MSTTAAPPPVSQRRSQAERRDESERLLVEATLKVVAEQGVSAATFEEIGRAAGYSRGLATQKFGSKAGLAEAVIAYLHRAREAVLEADHVGEMPAFEAIAYYVESHLRSLSLAADGRAYFMLLGAAVADANAQRPAFAASHDRVRVWLRSQLERGQASGDIRADVDPDAGALMIGSLMLGLSIQWLIDPGMDLEPIRRTTIQTLRQSLLAAGGTTSVAKES
ncbi:TetR/AcrR family transcriptional regulator [Phenylobacterium montanum]|uniref:TetR/AcrR family transcriptional regulator n=1 Tax=Phenylobacterium montanum TaxID=2823693 RepID=A0A975FYK9_9CAUL|nr:TetR/AcrR family transcriptional regulator [Caulobacter sp. S6]QUD87574.1 TetR/AcrR family transcriptional regulator [Caulobacter sp. S6]